MCDGHVQAADIEGSAKGPQGWFPLQRAQVVYDHPFHAQMAQSLMIDFVNPERGPGARVGVELSEGSARDLIEMIQIVLADRRHHAAGGHVC